MGVHGEGGGQNVRFPPSWKLGFQPNVSRKPEETV